MHYHHLYKTSRMIPAPKSPGHHHYRKRTSAVCRAAPKVISINSSGLSYRFSAHLQIHTDTSTNPPDPTLAKTQTAAQFVYGIPAEPVRFRFWSRYRYTRLGSALKPERPLLPLLNLPQYTTSLLKNRRGFSPISPTPIKHP